MNAYKILLASCAIFATGLPAKAELNLWQQNFVGCLIFTLYNAGPFQGRVEGSPAHANCRDERMGGSNCRWRPANRAHHTGRSDDLRSHRRPAG